MTRTKSKLGTIKPVKSSSRRYSEKSTSTTISTSTTTTLVLESDKKALEELQAECDKRFGLKSSKVFYWLILIPLEILILYLLIIFIRRLVG